MISYFKSLFSPHRELYKTLKEILGFYPTNIRYYEKAFIHRSASYIKYNGLLVNNERMEYLGDAILDAIVADFLFNHFPNEDEGFLTQMRSKIVNGDKLFEFSKSIGLPSLIVMNNDASISKKHIYGDAFEALIGAIYLDKGYKKTTEFVIHKIIKVYIDLNLLESMDTNFKSKLIEWGQKYKREIAFYTDFESFNSKYFISYVRVDNETFGSGVGLSKKQAEQKAAKETLIQVGELQLIEKSN